MKGIQKDTYIAAEWLISVLPNNLKTCAALGNGDEGKLVVDDPTLLIHLKEILIHQCGPNTARGNNADAAVAGPWSQGAQCLGQRTR